jgi:prolyl 4-hydroxylase
MAKAKSITKQDTTLSSSSPIVVPVPVTNSNGVSVTTLIILLILSSVFSTTLGPLLQHGLKRATEIYLGISSQNQLQNEVVVSAVQSQPEPVNLQARSHTEDGLLDPSTYVCKHSYSVRILHRDPFVMIIDDFLQPGEAEHVIAYAKPRMKRSFVGTGKYSQARTSSSAFLERSGDHVIRCIEERASQITGIPVNNTEVLQVVWYTKGQEFRPHFDYITREDLLKNPLVEFGQRYVTMLAYLNEPEEGGGTVFTKLGLKVTPKRNAALVWYNVGLNEKEDPRTIHSGAPVIRGEKYAINIWQRKMIPDIAKELHKREAKKQTQSSTAFASISATSLSKDGL